MTIQAFNGLSESAARAALQQCCGSRKWVDAMLSRRPFGSEAACFQAAAECWSLTGTDDWLEAFTHHPKIGDLDSLAKKFADTSHLAGSEQASVAAASRTTLEALAEGNEAYERKFGFIFIVCATGKSADEMLGLLRERLPNGRDQELRIAAGEQLKITRLRLEKLFA